MLGGHSRVKLGAGPVITQDVSLKHSCDSRRFTAQQTPSPYARDGQGVAIRYGE